MVNCKRGLVVVAVATLLMLLLASTVLAQDVTYLPVMSEEPTHDSICRCWGFTSNLFEFLYHEPQPEIECWTHTVSGPYGYFSDIALSFHWPGETGGFALMHTHHTQSSPHAHLPGGDSYSCSYAALLPYDVPPDLVFRSETLPGQADYAACRWEIGSILDVVNLTCTALEIPE